MRSTLHWLSTLLLVTIPAIGFGQALPVASNSTAQSDTAASQKMLLKIGLNPGRAFRYSGFHGIGVRAPLSVGAEYRLSSKFTLYGQVDTDFQLAARQEVYGARHFLIPTGALGVGARYYYNQARRARRNRPYGAFVGNYLALEVHTEMRQRDRTSTEVAPGLNLVWGTQRRLGRNFLLDFNAGLGLGPISSGVGFGCHGPQSNISINTQFNLGIYFGR